MKLQCREFADGDFDSGQMVNFSEIGMPSEDVLRFADELCTRFSLSGFKQEPDETFTPVGDDNGLLILPRKGRIWYPNTGVPAQLLPVKVRGNVPAVEIGIQGVPYEFSRRTRSTI